MKFKFIGSEPSEFMGFQWYPGTEHDVTDEHAVRKLSGSILFESLGGSDEPKAKKPGRKPQQVPNGDDAQSA